MTTSLAVLQIRRVCDIVGCSSLDARTLLGAVGSGADVGVSGTSNTYGEYAMYRAGVPGFKGSIFPRNDLRPLRRWAKKVLAAYKERS